MTDALQNYGSLQHRHERSTWIYVYEMTPKLMFVIIIHELVCWGHQLLQEKRAGGVTLSKNNISLCHISWCTGREATTALTVFIKHLLAQLTSRNTAYCQADHSQASRSFLCSDAFRICVQNLCKDSSGTVSLPGSPFTLSIIITAFQHSVRKSLPHTEFLFITGGVGGGRGGWGGVCVREKSSFLEMIDHFQWFCALVGCA